MKRVRRTSAAVLMLLAVALPVLAVPGLKHVSTSTTKFHGFMGTMMKMAGGNKPHTTATYLQGSQQRSDQLDEKGNLVSSRIIDLDREVFLNVDHKKKEYAVMTFAEWQEMMKKWQRELEQQPQGPTGAPETRVEFDVKIERTGEKQTIAGFMTEKVILHMTAKGSSQATATAPAAQGGMVITSTQWLAPQAPGREETMAFHREMAEKLGLAAAGSNAQNMMMSISRMNPTLASAMEKLAEEAKKLNGIALRTESVFETWGESQGQAGGEMEAEGKSGQPPASVGGMLGGLGKKMMKKPQASGGEPGKSVLFESTEETTELRSDSFAADWFTAPAGYKQVKAKM